MNINYNAGHDHYTVHKPPWDSISFSYTSVSARAASRSRESRFSLDLSRDLCFFFASRQPFWTAIGYWASTLIWTWWMLVCDKNICSKTHWLIPRTCILASLLRHHQGRISRRQLSSRKKNSQRFTMKEMTSAKNVGSFGLDIQILLSTSDDLRWSFVVRIQLETLDLD